MRNYFIHFYFIFSLSLYLFNYFSSVLQVKIECIDATYSIFISRLIILHCYTFDREINLIITKRILATHRKFTEVKRWKLLKSNYLPSYKVH